MFMDEKDLGKINKLENLAYFIFHFYFLNYKGLYSDK